MTKKPCFKCGKMKELESFYKHPQMSDGHVNKCKSCNKLDVKNNYKEKIEQYKAYERKRFQNPKRRENASRYARNRKIKHPGKAYANAKVGYALKNGSLVRPDKCTDCKGLTKVQAHHEDYRKALEVVWLCFQCHRKRHGQLNYGNS